MQLGRWPIARPVRGRLGNRSLVMIAFGAGLITCWSRNILLMVTVMPPIDAVVLGAAVPARLPVGITGRGGPLRIAETWLGRGMAGAHA